ncbi:MAG TPA: pyridoxamine 5'-phosphate oxidase [Pyrinomonadaceae bacterium]|jgi:pyridoxamine 5'-phosphate oxidase|nr:pyridoxamine 5'-phosphate oxidase [Pyrinomonadaceae bacterium]
MTNTTDTLDERLIDRDPVKQFQRWFDDAINASLLLPEAMSLATVTSDGKPTSRMVLLKGVDLNGFVFYTNYRSAKAKELDANPNAALVFFWPQLERQVRVEGRVTRTSAAESREYFATRPRGSQIGAWASPQSEVIATRTELEKRKAEFEERYRDREVDWPEHWGGYRLKPDRIEFWKGRPDRLHDRILYEREADGTWSIKRLAP